MITLALLNWEAPASIGAWLACLFFLVALFNQLARARQNFQGVPTASDVQQEITKHFTPRNEFDRHTDENRRSHEHIYATVSAKERSLREESRQGAGVLHEKINEVAIEIAGTKSAVVMQTQQIARVDAKIDRLIERRI